MALREIRKLGDPILRQKAVSLRDFKKAGPILEDMAQTMEHYRGVGLAAPQIGLGLALVTIRPAEELPVLELVNPRILKKKGEELEVEGCLSCPGTFGQVPRATEVELQYQDRRGRRKTLNATGFLARVIQHELDHLEGILFLDKASSLVDEEEGQWQS
jgi:peptide deformylase